MTGTVSSSALAARAAAFGGLSASIGALAWALVGSLGAITAIASLAALGWALGAAVGREREASQATAATPADSGKGAEERGAEERREPETVTERNADRDWRRVASGTAGPSPLDEVAGQAKRDADWLEL